MSSKRIFWLQHIEAWQASELSQAEYARQHQLSIKSFSYFRRRYARGITQKNGDAGKSPTLLPVQIESETTVVHKLSETGICLTSPEGFHIELSAGFDQQALRQVLTILAQVNAP